MCVTERQAAYTCIGFIISELTSQQYDTATSVVLTDRSVHSLVDKKVHDSSYCVDILTR